MKKNKTPPVPFIRNYSRNYSYYTKIRRQKIIRRILTVVGIAAIFILGYFLMTMLLDISHMQPV